MDGDIKMSGPQSWQDMKHGIHRRKETVRRRNQQIRTLKSEIDRLTQKLKNVDTLEIEECWKRIRHQEGEIDRLKAQNEKMRECILDIYKHTLQPFAGEKWILYVHEIAGHALKGA